MSHTTQDLAHNVHLFLVFAIGACDLQVKIPFIQNINWQMWFFVLHQRLGTVLGKITSNCRGGTSDTYSMMQKFKNHRVFGEDEKLNYCQFLCALELKTARMQMKTMCASINPCQITQHFSSKLFDLALPHVWRNLRMYSNYRWKLRPLQNLHLWMWVLVPIHIDIQKNV